MKKPSLSGLTKKLDLFFSIYIRLRAAKNGYAKCVSCGRRYPWSALQNGHYVKRSNRNLRWSERNCHPQCVGCNVFQNGNYPGYTKYLLDNYGQEWLQKLIKDGNKIKKWTIPQLEKEIEKYKKLIENL